MLEFRVKRSTWAVFGSFFRYFWERERITLIWTVITGLISRPHNINQLEACTSLLDEGTVLSFLHSPDKALATTPLTILMVSNSESVTLYRGQD